MTQDKDLAVTVAAGKGKHGKQDHKSGAGGGRSHRYRRGRGTSG